MPRWRISHDVWEWRQTALVMVLVASAHLAVLLVDPRSRSLAGAVAASRLIVFPLVLAAAVFTYIHWRLSGEEIARWLTISLAVIAGPNLTMAELEMVERDGTGGNPSGTLLVQALIMASLLIIAFVSNRKLPSGDPLGTGVVLALVLSLLTGVLANRPPPTELSMGLLVAFGLLPVLGALLLARLMMTWSELPAWGRLRLRLSLAAVLLALAQFAAQAPRSDHAAVTVELLALVFGAALLCSMLLALVRSSLQQNQRALNILNDELARSEATVRQDQSRLHEIGATVAGIASASHLIHDEPLVLTAPRRSALEEMIGTEIARLQRLLLEDSFDQHVFALDQILQQLVVSQLAQSHRVAWSPSGHLVRGRPDDVAEIVSVLLCNAAKHGRDAGAALTVRAFDCVVEIVVADAGPGVSREVRHQLFDWGVRGPDSAGQGIGLHIARDLVEKQGGYLLLEDSPSPGATFVVGLISGESDDALGFVAG